MKIIPFFERSIKNRLLQNYYESIAKAVFVVLKENIGRLRKAAHYTIKHNIKNFNIHQKVLIEKTATTHLSLF